MTGIEQFVFMDYGQLSLFISLEYMSIMGMFICVTYYATILIKGNDYDKK